MPPSPIPLILFPTFFRAALAALQHRGLMTQASSNASEGRYVLADWPGVNRPSSALPALEAVRSTWRRVRKGIRAKKKKIERTRGLIFASQEKGYARM